MVNKIIKIEKIETNSENNITNVVVELEHEAEQKKSIVVEFKGDNNKNSLEKFREEKWEKGGHLVKYNPDFLVEQKKFKNEKELGWKYFPLEPILTSPQEKISSEQIIFISALDYRVGMLCVPEKAKLAQDIRFVEAIESYSVGGLKRELSARNYGNYPIFIDSSKVFQFSEFEFNRASQIEEVKRFVCSCGFRYVIGQSSYPADQEIKLKQKCPQCENYLTVPPSSSQEIIRGISNRQKSYVFLELAYRVLQGEKEILKNELGRETKQAEIKENQQQDLLKKVETKLTQEKQAYNTFKQKHNNQLKELIAMLFPSNSDFDNISFGDLKEQVEKIIKENQDQAAQIQELKLTKSTIHQQTQTDFPIQKKRTQIEVKEPTTSHENNSIPLTEEERKWEEIKIGIEKETDLTRLANEAYWDTQIQNLPDNLLPANKKSIVLKNRLWQRERQLEKDKNQQEQQTEAKIENPPKGN